MLTERLDELKAIMSDHATYLEFPPLGSQTSLVSVYGDERANIHRAIRAVMLLVRLNIVSGQASCLLTLFGRRLRNTFQRSSICYRPTSTF